MSYYGPGDASDPWEQGAREHSGYDPYGEPSYPPAPPESTPAPAPARSSTALVVVLVSILVVVLCGGGVAALYLIGSKDRTPAANGPAAPSTSHATSPSTSPSPSYDPTSIIRGQCVANDGTQDAPVLRVVGCAPGTFKVLARFDGTIDENKCKSVPGSTHHYFYDTSPDTLDFVLCLQKQQ